MSCTGSVNDVQRKLGEDLNGEPLLKGDQLRLNGGHTFWKNLTKPKVSKMRRKLTSDGRLHHVLPLYVASITSHRLYHDKPLDAGWG